MVMSINKLARRSGDDIYYNPKFRRFFEFYLSDLRNDSNPELIPVDPNLLYKYEGDFYGLFSILGIRNNYHWITLRLNGFLDPMDTPSELPFIISPPHQKVTQIVQFFKQSNK